MRELRDGDFPFGAEFTAAVSALDNRGVLNGCGVSVNGTGSLGSGGNALDIASGDALHSGTSNAVGAQNADVATADSYKRYDPVTVNSSGTATTTTGTTKKTAPAIPSGEVLLAVVEVPANATIGDIIVYDSRALLHYYTDADARGAVEAGDLAHVQGQNGFRFDFNNSTNWVELVDTDTANNDRADLVTSDVYVNEQKTWLASHIGNGSAHHSRPTGTKAASVTNRQKANIREANGLDESPANLTDGDTSTYVSIDTVDVSEYVRFDGDGYRITDVHMYVDNSQYEKLEIRDGSNNYTIASIGNSVTGWVTRTVNWSGDLFLWGNAYAPNVYELEVSVEKVPSHSHNI